MGGVVEGEVEAGAAEDEEEAADGFVGFKVEVEGVVPAGVVAELGVEVEGVVPAGAVVAGIFLLIAATGIAFESSALIVIFLIPTKLFPAVLGSIGITSKFNCSGKFENTVPKTQEGFFEVNWILSLTKDIFLVEAPPVSERFMQV